MPTLSVYIITTKWYMNNLIERISRQLICSIECEKSVSFGTFFTSRQKNQLAYFYYLGYHCDYLCVIFLYLFSVADYFRAPEIHWLLLTTHVSRSLSKWQSKKIQKVIGLRVKLEIIIWFTSWNVDFSAD